MKKTGLADSPFFSAQKWAQEAPASPPVAEPAAGKKKRPSVGQRGGPSPIKSKKAYTTIPRHHDTTTPRNHDTTVSRYHDTIIELVRKAVKELGKEAATHRFTQEEKRALADIIYAYKNQGIKTSENEIARVAINFIIGDYKENGENSVLDRVLRALNT
jgi:hypothetical protein